MGNRKEATEYALKMISLIDPSGINTEIRRKELQELTDEQFDQLMKKSAAQKEKPVPQEKPVTRITASKGTATKSPSQMTDREFAKWRQTQIKNRNK